MAETLRYRIKTVEFLDAFTQLPRTPMKGVLDPFVLSKLRLQVQNLLMRFAESINEFLAAVVPILCVVAAHILCMVAAHMAIPMVRLRGGPTVPRPTDDSRLPLPAGRASLLSCPVASPRARAFQWSRRQNTPVSPFRLGRTPIVSLRQCRRPLGTPTRRPFPRLCPSPAT